MKLKSTLIKWSMLLLFSQLLVANSKADGLVYCSPSFLTDCSLGPWNNQNIVLDSINWSVTDCSISDYTSLSTTLVAGDSVTMSVTNGNWCGATVWIDFNQDEVFDSTENLYYSYNGNQTYTYNFYIHIPSGVSPGSYRMRVLSPWGSDGYTVGSGNGWGACGSYQYGNFDDFTINIVSGGCTVSANANHAAVCKGDSIMLSGTGSNMMFAWSNGVNDGVSFTPDSTVTYTLTGTDTVTTCIATDTITVVVNPLPVVAFSTPNDTLVCNWGGPSTFTVMVSPPGGTLTGPGVVVSTTNFDPFTANVGNDTITYSYTNGNGCSNSASINIVVNICEGISEGIKLLNDISVYPVPANNYVDIDLPKSSEKITMKLFNLEGKLILEQTLLSGQNRINMQPVSAGVYSLQMKSGMAVETQKIVVVK